jgi:hypothetical protein
MWVAPKTLADADGMPCRERLFNDGRVAQEQVELNENELTQNKCVVAFVSREKLASLLVMRSAGLEGRKQDVGVNGEH